LRSYLPHFTEIIFLLILYFPKIEPQKVLFWLKTELLKELFVEHGDILIAVSSPE